MTGISKFEELNFYVMISNESMIMMRKTCQQCGRPVRGRIDKKFCDDYCRNTYNNKLKGMSNNLVRNINNALRKNYRILGNLLEDEAKGMTKTKKERLERLGFQFQYLTHSDRKGDKQYHYVYDHGYLAMDNDWVLIIKQGEQGS
jgi:hypothetical protein